jgi:hypothetical protein
VGGDFDHMPVCFGQEPLNCEHFPRARAEPKFMMIEITMIRDGSHRNAQATGLD